MGERAPQIHQPNSGFICVFFLLDGPSDEQLKITSVLKQNHVT